MFNKLVWKFPNSSHWSQSIFTISLNCLEIYSGGIEFDVQAKFTYINLKARKTFIIGLPANIIHLNRYTYITVNCIGSSAQALYGRTDIDMSISISTKFDGMFRRPFVD